MSAPINRLIFLFAFVYAFITPPFIFEQMSFSSRELRAFFGIVVILLILLRTVRIKFNDIFVVMCVLVLFSIEMIWPRSEMNNIISYYAIVLFYVFMFVILRKGKVDQQTYLRMWIKIAYFLSITSIILFVLHQASSVNTDFLHFESLGDFSKRDNRFSILGVTQVKNFGFIRLVRSFSYFAEPQFAAFYFMINILICKKINTNGSYQRWFWCNLCAGLLTFSITFYGALLIFLIMSVAEKKNKFQFVVISFFLLAVVLPLFVISESLFSGSSNGAGQVSTSYSDREIRMVNAITILKKTSVFNLILGHGVGFTEGADRGLGSGFFHVLVERGVTGLSLVLGMMLLFVKRNFVSSIVCLLFLFAFPWYVQPIFWMGLLALWVGGTLAERTADFGPDKAGVRVGVDDCSEAALA